MKITDVLDRYLREVVPKHAPRTQADYAWHIGKLKQHFGEIDIKELKPQDVGQFLDVETGKVSRNRSVSVLSAMYTKAVGKWWLCDSNPCLKVERNETKHRTRYITNAEFAAVRDMAPERVQLAMDLALLTGQRQGDLLDLRWQNATRQGCYFQQSKTGKKIFVEYSPLMWEIMCKARKHTPRMPRRYVIRNLKGERYTSEGFRSMWQRLMKMALKAGVIKEKYTFHDIRAKCVSDTVDIHEAMMRAGHTNMQITRSVYDRNTRVVKALK